ncbi:MULTISPECIES: tRNA 2-thiouridine-synthesizing protein [unclassified Corynebacterium]|uniref:tRNA 2-thiouridine-synthesizing protein n=2 Tax=Corynebacterium TaxID=1716 RepID=UPI000A3A1FF6|nr:tRNA 2-thiouridine-synthesizing protein [Corynebacterium kefirresidentii]
MDQRQISTVVEQVEQGIVGLQDIDKLLAYLDSLHPDELGGVEFLVDRMFEEEERNQIWDLTESLKEFLSDLKECQK